MSTYTRQNGRRIILSDDKVSSIVRFIRAHPGQRVSDYEIMLAGKDVFVSANDINLTLECTTEGKKLVRGGKVSYRKTRGKAPAWTMIKGAVINAPDANYSPAIYQPRRLTDETLDTAITADANHMLDMVAAAITRPTRGKTRFATVAELSLQIENTARREDSRAKALTEANYRIESAHATIGRLTQVVSALDQGAQTLLAHHSVPATPAPAETPEPA